MNKKAFHCILSACIGIALTACAAGGGETGTGETSTVTVGVITGFGSVFVNGVKYETSPDTTVTLDDNVSAETNLKVGMVVTLSGSVNADGTTGSALNISFDDNVEGMVLSNTVLTNNQLSILGQTIVIDDFDTVFESAIPGVTDFASIEIGNIVEVSGHTAGDGTIYATRVEVKQKVRNDGDEIELEGLASNVNGFSFQIGNIGIIFTADKLDNFEGQNLKNGDYVEVKSTKALNDIGQIVASKIELKNRYKTNQQSAEDKVLKLEGVITQVTSEVEFALNGQTIIFGNATKINEPKSIVLGKKAKVEGKLNAENQIVATEIEIKQENKAKIEGVITAINPGTKTITVLGDEITITNSTTVKDERDGVSDNDRHFFNFNNLKLNDKVEVSYFIDADLNRIAIKLELEDAESDDDGSKEDNDDSDDSETNNEQKTDWQVKNTITAYDAVNNTIELFSRTIDVSNIKDFIGAAAIGKEAEVKGIIVNGTWVATKLEVHDENDDEPSEKQEIEIEH